MDRLEEMMKDMQTQYKQLRYPHPTVDNIKEGRLYAALHHDGLWYRYVVTSNWSLNIKNGCMQWSLSFHFGMAQLV
jgi:hypothetical protein